MTVSTSLSHLILACAVLATVSILGVMNVISGVDCFAVIVGIATAGGVYVGVTAANASASEAAATGAAKAIEELSKQARA